MIYRWRNDPDIASMGKTKHFPYEEHERWFKAKLMSPDSHIFIVESDQAPVGQIRYDRQVDGYYISLYVIAPHKNAGIGSKALALTSSQLRRDIKAPLMIIADVLKDNKHSIKFFKKNGFSFDDSFSDIASVRLSRNDA